MKKVDKILNSTQNDIPDEAEFLQSEKKQKRKFSKLRINKPKCSRIHEALVPGSKMGRAHFTMGKLALSDSDYEE